jgi:hypothetical protein
MGAFIDAAAYSGAGVAGRETTGSPARRLHTERGVSQSEKKNTHTLRGGSATPSARDHVHRQNTPTPELLLQRRATTQPSSLNESSWIGNSVTVITNERVRHAKRLTGKK